MKLEKEHQKCCHRFEVPAVLWSRKIQFNSLRYIFVFCHYHFKAGLAKRITEQLREQTTEQKITRGN